MFGTSSWRRSLNLLLPLGCLVLVGIGCARPAADRGVLRSLDAGEKWEQKARISEDETIAGANWWALAVSPEDSQRVLIGGEETGVWVSENGTENWSQTNLQELNIRSLAFGQKKSSSVVYAAGYTESAGFIYKSEDAGANWTQVYTVPGAGEIVSVVAVDPQDASVVYAGTDDGELLISDDGGQSWVVNTRFPSPVNDIEVGLDDSRLVFAATNSSGIWRTTTAGKKPWVRLTSNESDGGFTRTSKVFDVAIDPALPSILYAGTTHGLTRSRDSGDTWEDVPLLVEPGSVASMRIALDPQSFQPVYLGIGGSLYSSEDFGASWKPQQLSAHTVTALEVDPKNPLALYAAIQEAD